MVGRRNRSTRREPAPVPFVHHKSHMLPGRFGRTKTEGMLERGTRETIWTQKGWNRGCWKELHIEELHNYYSLPNIAEMIESRWTRWTGHVAVIGKKRSGYRVLVGKPEEKEPLGIPWRKLQDNIKIDLNVIEWGCIYYIDLVQDRSSGGLFSTQ
jgi:hypothetical protein